MWNAFCCSAKTIFFKTSQSEDLLQICIAQELSLLHFGKLKKAFLDGKLLKKDCFCALPKMLHKFILSNILDITMNL